jgi:5-methylthioadenosine/S-adenosylhomocysteine deaminase
LQGLGLLDGNLIAAHCVHLNPDEIELLAKTQTNIAHCPHSNLKLGSGIAPTTAMLNAGINVTIGTDGSASNNRLDLIAEARTACLLAKGASGDAKAFNAHAALAALTFNAAKALGKEQRLGSIEVGKLADLVAFDFSGFAMQPVQDPVAHLLYTSSCEHVAYVWINGQLVAQKRQLVGSTPNRVLSEVTARIPLWHNRGGEILSAVV